MGKEKRSRLSWMLAIKVWTKSNRTYPPNWPYYLKVLPPRSKYLQDKHVGALMVKSPLKCITTHLTYPEYQLHRICPQLLFGLGAINKVILLSYCAQNPRDTESSVQSLVARSLVQARGVAYFVHDLLLDFAMKEIGMKIKEVATSRQAQYLGRQTKRAGELM